MIGESASPSRVQRVRPASESGVPSPDAAITESADPVHVGLDLHIDSDVDLDTVTATLLAAHDALQHRLSDLSS